MPEVWSRADLRRDGIGDGRLWRLQRAGALVRVGYGSYVRAGVPSPLAAVVARPGRGAALFGVSAAAHRGLPAEDSLLHVVVEHGSRRRWVPDAVVVHQTRRWHAELLGGVAVTPLARTLADVARTVPLLESVPVLDAGLRSGVPRDHVLRELGAPAPGHGRARHALDRADGRAESPLESRLRLLLVEAGLPPDDVQHVIRERGRFVARVDLWYDGVVVEADGFDYHRGRDDYRGDRRKGQAFARLGLLLLRFSWEDVVHHPDAVVASVRSALAHAA